MERHDEATAYIVALLMCYAMLNCAFCDDIIEPNCVYLQRSTNLLCRTSELD